MEPLRAAVPMGVTPPISTTGSIATQRLSAYEMAEPIARDLIDGIHSFTGTALAAKTLPVARTATASVPQPQLVHIVGASTSVGSKSASVSRQASPAPCMTTVSPPQLLRSVRSPRSIGVCGVHVESSTKPSSGSAIMQTAWPTSTLQLATTIPVGSTLGSAVTGASSPPHSIGQPVIASATAYPVASKQHARSSLPASRVLTYQGTGLADSALVPILSPSMQSRTSSREPSLERVKKMLECKFKADGVVQRASPTSAEAVTWLPPADDRLAGHEVAVKDLELRVLRSEVEATELEAMRLRERVRDADIRFVEASGTVGTLAAKVETTAGNRHAVMEASTRNIDSQVSALQRRLARMQWELSEKDEEIRTLQQSTQDGLLQANRQKEELQALQRNQFDQDSRVALLAENATRLQRHQMVGEWRGRVQAHIQQEMADVQVLRERREIAEQTTALEEEIGLFKAFLGRTEEKCKSLQAEALQRQKQYDGLLMEERLCTSAARLGHGSADEQRRYQIAELRALEARLREEMARKAARTPQARVYEATEAGSIKNQRVLAALTACMAEISRTLHDSGFPGSRGLAGESHHGGTSQMSLAATPQIPTPAAQLSSSVISPKWGIPALVEPIKIGGAGALLAV